MFTVLLNCPMKMSSNAKTFPGNNKRQHFRRLLHSLIATSYQYFKVSRTNVDHPGKRQHLRSTVDSSRTLPPLRPVACQRPAKSCRRNDALNPGYRHCTSIGKCCDYHLSLSHRNVDIPCPTAGKRNSEVFAVRLRTMARPMRHVWIIN